MYFRILISAVKEIKQDKGIENDCACMRDREMGRERKRLRSEGMLGRPVNK